MDVFKQRLDDDFELETFYTTPQVKYQAILKKDNEILEIENASEIPDNIEILYFKEPVVEANILIPVNYLKEVLHLCYEKRGEQQEMSLIDNKKYKLRFIIPLSELITDFFDKLKCVTQGYGSLDYEHKGYRKAPIKKL